MALIEARAVSKVFSASAAREIRAVDEVSLTIEAGNCWTLTGPSGSGKSTLLALLGAIERPTSGEIHFDGKSLAHLSDIGLAGVRRRLGFVFQSFALLPRLTVWENVSYPLVPQGIGRGQRLSSARALLEPFGLADRSFDPADTLSGGEQQRVALARALIGRPQAILADEPTSQLDDQAAETVVNALRDLSASGVTLILATHDPQILALASHVATMKSGRLVSAT